MDEKSVSQETLGLTYYIRAQLVEMNERFIAAMAAAIRAGLERPPRVGIDRRPGTKNPLPYIDRGSEVRQRQGRL
jgi:hypothetical protein